MKISNINPKFMMIYALVEDEVNGELRLDIDISDFAINDISNEQITVDLDIPEKGDIDTLKQLIISDAS